MLIARLIADPLHLGTRLDALLAALAGQGMPVAGADTLAGGRGVLELRLPAGDAAVLRELIEAELAPVAALITAREIEVPKLFISDMDSTMIGQECIDELADFAGIKDRVAAITERAMRGELDFAAALHERVALLNGLNESAIQACLEERIRPVEGARKLVGTLKAHGCHTVLVTGGFHHFADPVASQLGFDEVVANRLALKDRRLTGTIEGGIVDSAVKRSTLVSHLARLGEGARALATGDGANDIAMLEAADFGIAYVAKPLARAAANGWLDGGSLTNILDLLAIPRENWAG